MKKLLCVYNLLGLYKLSLFSLIGLSGFFISASYAENTLVASLPANSESKSTATLKPDQAELNLRKAKNSYQNGLFKDAEDKLTLLLKQFNKSPAAEEAAIILADVYLRQGKTDPAANTLNRFRKIYPASIFTPRANYYQALLFLKTGKNSEAAKNLLNAANAALPATLSETISKTTSQLALGNGLNSEDLQTLLDSWPPDATLKPLFLESLGDAFVREGKLTAARSAYQDWIQLYPKHDHKEMVQRKISNLAATVKKSKNILVMAPFTGEYTEIGKSIKEGVTLALDEINARGGMRLEAHWLDDQGNPLLAVQKLRKSLKEESIDAIIGPAMSDVSIAVAVELSARKSKIPMITPTATTQGISSLGEGIFQLNVTTAGLGQSIAAYAMSCLHLKDFAILAPQSEYGQQLAEAFQKAIEKKGGNLVANETYNPEASDYAQVFDNIRKKIAKLITDREKLTKGAAGEMDAKTYKSMLADSVLALDALFIPANNGDEAFKLASQTSYNKLRTQMLGSSGWNDKSILHKNAVGLQGSVFSLDFPESSKAEAWTTFQKNYSAKWKRVPDKIAGLGYDATRFLLEGLNVSSEIEELNNHLRNIKTFNGVQGKFIFNDHSGTNQNTAFYRLEKKGFRELETCPEME